ncbi:glycerophosphodiester phosphodiesterase [Lacticaseibacillus casei]|uniref:Glycerophosphodiester phosphodiesterase n=2 Tax=Lacticaseibacillus TaxID=2759736 RepID=A0ABY8DUL3_9LACO|nr:MULTISPECIES: glycerophosphodiester phosphodiesterase [Lacticaseibacillus]MDG3060524.1 glycerophosphodiester phosphodiesterase [Lacticaseibacillus sp. BCRC 81376]QVI38735.1 glycerophosphodiester phosphodiesterase [Lacticaseibacillus casei]QXG60554.1 glycerophosphodiester phosphodiesterase [Lacticaseibacillus casei]WFB40691.1 glycerophosphodiester phosphodiesterase [Lacticaseibacillus huelsenbergensis]WFB43436.1 glycerophosphodiester phosphodiesterase [Lacticaseibacillus huelsenbergensis]
MMNEKIKVWAYFKHNSQDFARHWGAYFLLISVTNLVVGLAIIPLLTFGAQQVLRLGNVPYITLTNLGQIATAKPVTALLLLLIGLILLLFVYWQFAFLLLGIQNIHRQTHLSFRQLAGATIRKTRRLTPTTILSLIAYFVLIFPFSSIVFKTSLLAKLTIPDFIIDYIFDRWYLTVLIVVLYLLGTWLAIRLLPLLPALILNDQSPRATVVRSWRATRGQTWRTLWAVILIVIPVLVLSILLVAGLYAFQTYLDQQWQQWSLLGATINLGLLQVAMLLITVFFTVMLYQLATSQAETFHLIDSQDHVVQIPKRRRNWVFRVSAFALIMVIIGGTSLFYHAYLIGALTTQPLTISHRGVDNGNGVQNTIPALLATAKEKPDYVEMDLHETKDHQFVVMHDENLKALTGKDAAPHQLTLAEITQLTARENGHAAKVASFDQYLAAAEQVHQKLLVEIKTTPHDSPQMMDRFIKRYAKRLLANHDQVHSLDYGVVKTLRQRVPKLKTFFILPYTLVFPETPASGYTLESTTLSTTVADQAHDHHQAVYAWTINDPDDMQKMTFMDADGIITDQLRLLKTTLREMNDHPSYADQLLNYLNGFSTEDNAPF